MASTSCRRSERALAAALLLALVACASPVALRPSSSPQGEAGPGAPAFAPPPGIALEATCVTSAHELCFDAVDNNCNGLIDEGGPDFDDDGDGLTDNDGDCDDGDPWVYPAAFEFCDYYDNDCDGVTDNGPDGEDNGACAFLPERKTAQ